MAVIDDFVKQARTEAQGHEDKKIRIGEVIPKVEETEDGDNWFFEPAQPSMFQTTGLVWNLNRWSFSQFCKRISPNDARLDFRYVKACGPELGLQQLKFWSQIWKEREGYFRLSVDPQSKRTVVRAVLTGLYQPIDSHQVGNYMSSLVDKDQEIEFVLTEDRWLLQYWLSQGYSSKYGVGFRVMGSEVGMMKHVRFDVMLQFQTDKGLVSVPVMVDRAPLCTIPYSGSGHQALARLDLSLKRGTQAAEEAKENIAARKLEPLKYAVDEFHELVSLQSLPSEMRALTTESPKLFQGIKTKFDLAMLLGKIAAEASGYSRLKIESAAGIYLMTGRVKSTRNRNDE